MSFIFIKQYGESLTNIENSIVLVQKRAMEQADIDSSSWLGPDEENYTITEPEFHGVNMSLFKNKHSRKLFYYCKINYIPFGKNFASIRNFHIFVYYIFYILIYFK